MIVKQFHNKNQFVITDGERIVFQSYDTTIAEINGDGKLKLFGDWDYSQTTLKHLYLFLFDYIHKIEQKTREKIQNIYYSTNKRKEIQNLIDDKIIKFEQ